MNIKAIGTIVANRGDGRTVEVEWNPEFVPKVWYFYTHRGTVWHLKNDKDYKYLELSKQLIDFVWYGKAQEYSIFTEMWWRENEIPDLVNPYSVEDMIAAGVFLGESELETILAKIREKKAMIIQGAPGVGKTFMARKLAFALMEEEDKERVEFIQFHQSYSYDDFVRGYRPLQGKPGTFGIQNGIFFEFCEKARNDPEREYIFIIDEINRGNLSQIFGELLMLVEADKRGKDFSVPLVYRMENDERFYIPSNLYLIGLMNLADRSLAMVDYALRRRFSFITLHSQTGNPIFKKWLEDRSMKSDLIELISTRISELNTAIREDSLLGENYEIGHSYFCPRGDNFEELDRCWYDGIIKTEIVPLLKEYWYDNSAKVIEQEMRLES